MLSAASRITREDSTLLMLVRAKTRDDEVLGHAFAKKQTIELEHQGQLLKVRILGCELREHLVLWRGEIL